MQNSMFETIPLVEIKQQTKIMKCIYQEHTYEINIEPYTFVNQLIPKELQGTYNVIHFGTRLQLNKSVEYYIKRFDQYGYMVHLTPPTQVNPQQQTNQAVRSSTPDELYLYLLYGIVIGFLFSVFTLIPLRIKSDEYNIFKAGCFLGISMNVVLKSIL
eukprot:NODE_613_length_5985_cov_0.176351.p3 type:complete len:158 gc:universal NODE_613_length_5985_cov_0.176351:211-684(+)